MADRVGIPYIQQAARVRGLDPRAVLAVARQEGLGGGIGDNGTSFGPWQLHQGGALPRGIPLSNAQSWAWSPAGVNYALDSQAKVARGLTGREAITNIVQRFERPANPGREIQGALKAYGANLFAGVASPPKEQSEFAPARSPISGDVDRRQAIVKWALGASESFLNGKEMPSLSGLLAALSTQQKGSQSLVANNVSPKGAKPVRGLSSAKVSVPRGFFTGVHASQLQGENPEFLNRFTQAVRAAGGTQVDVISGYRSPEYNRQIGGATRSNHTRGMAIDARVLLNGKWVPAGDIPTLARFGLRSGDQPGFFRGARDPNHVDLGYLAGL